MPLPADTALPWMAYVDALVGCSNKEWIRLRAADLRVYIASWENISRSEPSETLVQLTHEWFPSLVRTCADGYAPRPSSQCARNSAPYNRKKF